ncbi:hypothetical protein [Mycolicibacterium agri]|uniref:hypothetical protein n=1 Tax=Mycolicibacterium agri TaxID=36811 RepID=UPI0010562AFA|nr:hypothetical protein [Mycolicibacterium agri]
MSVLDRAGAAIDWISEGYRPAARPLAALRIVFALYVLVWPRDISWLATMSATGFDPPAGPFSLLPGPAPATAIHVLEVLRVVVALWLLIGWKTGIASGLLALILVVCSGLAYSFGKSDDVILFDLAPLMLGLAGWGSAWSKDARLGSAARPRGFPMFVYATLIAFAMFTAAAAKATTGWLLPTRQATRFFVVVTADSPRSGLLADTVLRFDNAVFWKALDYATAFVEGWLVVAVFIPILFRVGLVLMGLFHVGVWLLLGIDFHLHAFVYAGFFLVPPACYWRELALLRNVRTRLARPVAVIPQGAS